MKGAPGEPMQKTTLLATDAICSKLCTQLVISVEVIVCNQVSLPDLRISRSLVGTLTVPSKQSFSASLGAARVSNSYDVNFPSS